MRKVLKRALETHGYRVIGARNGAEALGIALGCAEPIHALVSDVVMPEMTGADLARRLAALGPGLRVLLVSWRLRRRCGLPAEASRGYGRSYSARERRTGGKLGSGPRGRTPSESGGAPHCAEGLAGARRTAQDGRAVEDLRALADQAFSRAAGAPLVGGNQVRLLRDATENYPAWLAAIASARRHVHFENYIIHEDACGQTFASALLERARAGVRVRLIYDWPGGFRATTGSRSPWTARSRL